MAMKVDVQPAQEGGAGFLCHSAPGQISAKVEFLYGSN